ncbi:MAG: FMN-binding protein [Gammaproteobacteria bacterium]
MGVVVNSGRITRLDVLIFRVSRGRDVRHPFCTQQFRGARLDTDGRLDRNVDGITGATLSVHALIRVARFALLLHRHTEFADGTPQHTP